MENTNELDKISPEKVTLMIRGKEREIKFAFSAWRKISKEYGGLKNFDKLQKKIESEPFETVSHVLWIGLSDKEGVTEEDFLDDYGLGDIALISEKFAKAFYGSLPKSDGKKAKVEA